MVVHITDMTSDYVKGEVQVGRAFFFSVIVFANGRIICKCRYTNELGRPCYHAIRLIDEAYKITRNRSWDITHKKW